ncbi:MerR family transcriptional regulator [Streptomyces sp. NPDC058964]|uniref:MerR family transcriptional regulator n=1 Tax=Streptomyces sp. NPDC058964 TaxID=3346681 RepID=UPI0036A4DD3A
MRIGEPVAAGAPGARPRHHGQAGPIASGRAATGCRVHGAGAVVRVRNIRQLLESGPALDDVRVFLPCLDGGVTAGRVSAKGVRVALDRPAVTDARIAAQTAERDRLTAALRELGGAGP